MNGKGPESGWLFEGAEPKPKPGDPRYLHPNFRRDEEGNIVDKEGNRYDKKGNFIGEPLSDEVKKVRRQYPNLSNIEQIAKARFLRQEKNKQEEKQPKNK